MSETKKQPSLTSILKDFPNVERNEPVLTGHIFYKVTIDNLSLKKVSDWATVINVENGFPVVSFSNVCNAVKKLKNYKKFFFKSQSNFISLCKKPIHKLFSSRSSFSTTTTTSNPSSSTTTTSNPSSTTTTTSNPSSSTRSTSTRTPDSDSSLKNSAKISEKPTHLASILKDFEKVEGSEPVLTGHIFYMLAVQHLPMMKISEWATGRNVANGFPVIRFFNVCNAARKLKNYRKGFFHLKSGEFITLCKKPVHKLLHHKLSFSTSNPSSSPSQLLIDSSSSSSLKQRLAKAKNMMPLKEDENAEKKTDYPMKTRSGRSSLPVIKKKIKPTVNNGTGKNILIKRRRGKLALNATNNNHNASNYRESRKLKKLYDEAGALLSNGNDYCDCLEADCPGCHFPCKKCGSEKCGPECRCERAWIYDEVKIEGLGITLKNSAC